jgi:threonyl-tRNA synthetase
MLVVGEKEMEEKTVAVRKQGEGDQGSKSLAEFAAIIAQAVCHADGA